MAIRIVDLDAPPQPELAEASLPGDLVICYCSDPEKLAAGEKWTEQATLTLVGFATDDVRAVTVTDVDAEINAITDWVSRHPLAAQICDDVLRANTSPSSLAAGLTVESLAYSTLQAGPEFARWLSEQPPRARHDSVSPVILQRGEPETLTLTFNRPEKHNAFSNALRAGLLDGLQVASLDPTVRHCVLRGAGASFCSGGDLKEFGLSEDVAQAHIARTRFSPALALEAVTRRLGPAFVAQVHGAVMGSGLEMAAYCGTVRSDKTAQFGLPELRLGLIPGAGGTVSVTRRIGRWRTAYLVLSGAVLEPETALKWGLVDELVDSF